MIGKIITWRIARNLCRREDCRKRSKRRRRGTAGGSSNQRRRVVASGLVHAGCIARLVRVDTNQSELRQSKRIVCLQVGFTETIQARLMLHRSPVSRWQSHALRACPVNGRGVVCDAYRKATQGAARVKRAPFPLLTQGLSRHLQEEGSCAFTSDDRMR